MEPAPVPELTGRAAEAAARLEAAGVPAGEARGAISLALAEGASPNEVRHLVKETIQKGGPGAALDTLVSFRRLVAEGLDEHEARKAVLKAVKREAKAHRETARDEEKATRKSAKEQERLEKEIEKKLEEKRLAREFKKERRERERDEERREERRDRDEDDDEDRSESGSGSGGGN